MIKTEIPYIGYVDFEILDLSTGEKISIHRKNTVLAQGKSLLARTLAQNINDPFDFFINKMVFGTGGENDGVPRTIDSGRTSLHNQVLEINVASDWSSADPNKVKFIGTIEASSTANNLSLNEAGLKTESGHLFSMITFPGLTKTSSLQFTLNWSIVFV